MESINESKYQELEKIQIAAGFNSMYVIPNLTQLIGYRQRIAQEVLRSTGDSQIILKELYDKVNNDIKALLGI